MSDGNGELRGVVRGRTIELEEETGLPDGESVEVIVRLREAVRSPQVDPDRLERFKRLAGAWAGDDEEGLDEHLRWCREQRQTSRPDLEP